MIQQKTLFDQFLLRTQPIHFWQSRDQIETWRADDLRVKISSIAEVMRSCNVSSGDTVALMLPTGIDLVASILATWSYGTKLELDLSKVLGGTESFYENLNGVLK